VVDLIPNIECNCSYASVQRLIEWLTTLSRFVPRLIEKTKPIVPLLCKATKSNWTDECEEIFLQLKAFLASPPVIQKSNSTEPIIIYLVVLEYIVRSTLVQEVEKEERPIYFVNRVLHDIELRYQMIEKISFVRIYGLKQEGGELFINDFRKL